MIQMEPFKLPIGTIRRDEPTTSYARHPEAVWPKDLPECTRLNCYVPALSREFWPKSRATAYPSQSSREILRPHGLRMTVAQRLPFSSHTYTTPKSIQERAACASSSSLWLCCLFQLCRPLNSRISAKLKSKFRRLPAMFTCCREPVETSACLQATTASSSSTINMHRLHLRSSPRSRASGTSHCAS